MTDLIQLPTRIFPGPQTDAADGVVKPSVFKAAWFLGHLAVTITFVWQLATPGAVIACFILTCVTLCCGHSVGLHRLLIHRSFRCPKWVERTLVYLGILVGMGGPFGMMYLHEIRDWAQKQSKSHPFFGHTMPWWKDAWWQLCCEIQLHNSLHFRPEPKVAEDPWYRFLQQTWMAQQIPLALLLGALGGWSWIVWGISVRILISLTGHWFIGHLAHNYGHAEWRIDGASVQGYNVPYTGIISMGEGLHNNHHAFPRSARYGHQRHADPGWWFLLCLRRLGLAQNLQTPETLPDRPELRRVDQTA